MAVAAEDAPDAADSTRPLMLGYLRAHILMTDNELAAGKDELEQLAHQQGYTLGTVYVERVDRMPAAFGALLDAMERDAPAAIGIPSVLHLAPLGFPPKPMHYLESITGVRVLIANAPPWAGGIGISPDCDLLTRSGVDPAVVDGAGVPRPVPMSPASAPSIHPRVRSAN